MNYNFIKAILLYVFTISQYLVYAQSNQKPYIKGNLYIDNTWESSIYLSYIPKYEDMYQISSDMVIAETKIDSLGKFKFDINFLPTEKKLYRLHIIKKGDAQASLIIGGRNENHLFLIASNTSKINITSRFSYPPFRSTSFINSPENIAFHSIRSKIFKSDSIFSESSAAKRSMLKKNMQEDLLIIADTSSFSLVSLYAIYKSNFKNNYASNKDFYKRYLEKWKDIDNSYFNTFRKQTPIKTSKTQYYLILILITIIIALVYFFRKKVFYKKKKITTLSIQERKIFELLREGFTNQEISNQCSISVSTVKSHVSNIYSKLNIKSRKEVMSIDL